MFQNFVTGLSCIQNPYAHFRGVKAAALMFHSTPQTVATIKLLTAELNYIKFLGNALGPHSGIGEILESPYFSNGKSS